MGRSMESSVLILLAMVSCVYLGSRVSAHPNGAQKSAVDEIPLDRVQVFVKIENGSTFNLMMEPDDRVIDLYDDIWDYEGVHSEFMELRFGSDQRLEYNAKLSECNIGAGSTVSLRLPERVYRKSAEFNVTTLDGRVLRVETQLGNSVSSLMDNITQWAGIPQAAQRLLLNGKELKAERRLAEHGITNGTQIQLGRPLEDCNQTVAVFVKTPSGATIEVEANLADTVAELKERIAKKAGPPASVQRLMTTKSTLTGIDHLCDLGLEANSNVYMYLYTSRITNPEQVARLQEPIHRAPIFREAADAHGPGISLFRDARNWIAQGGLRPGWAIDHFDPSIFLEPNPDSAEWIKDYEEFVERLTRPGAEESDRLAAEILRARIRLSSAVRSYRVAANLSEKIVTGEQPRMSLAGKFAGGLTGQRQPPVPLGTDVNNWAPDAFTDADIMRLFEVCERVRRVLTRAARTGQGILSIANQRLINSAILTTYLEALAGYPRAAEYNQAKEGASCGVCQDDLTVEPATGLACGHAYHADCLLQWVISSYRNQRYPSCPYCRARFMFPFEVLGQVGLETEAELQDIPEDDE